MTSTSDSDHALRTISDDGSFRILIASTLQTARGVLDAQAPGPELRPLVADLVSATVLLRLTMSPDYRLQAIVQNRSAGNIVADSHPDGTTRGLVRLKSEAPIEMGESTHFSVHRTMFGGDLHQGVVETSANQSLADVVTGYLHRSEQISSVVGLSHSFDGDMLVSCGGYIIQLLPNSDEATLALMTARLEQFPPTSELFETCGHDPEAIARELFGPIGFHTLGTDQFHSGCLCNKDRILDALATLSQTEIEELATDEFLEIDCEYCTTTHRIETALLSQPQAP